MVIIKKSLIIFFLVYSISPVISFEFCYKNVNYRDMNGYGYQINNKTLNISNFVSDGVGKPKKEVIEVINSSDLDSGFDHYFYTDVFGEKKCIIPGSRFLFLFPGDSEKSENNDFSNSLILHDVELKFKETGHLAGIHAMCYEENLIKSIISSSQLKEGSIIYNTSLLNKRLVFGEAALSWNGDVHPWVEGVSGPGIGETLDIFFSEPSRDIVILNGFVDPTRRHLYRYNNRVKTAIIRSNDSGEPFKFEHVFEDIVHFDEIKLPRLADRIIFEIKDVYPGEKWDDTCISAVLTREPDPYK